MELGVKPCPRDHQSLCCSKQAADPSVETPKRVQETGERTGHLSMPRGSNFFLFSSVLSPFGVVSMTCKSTHRELLSLMEK